MLLLLHFLQKKKYRFCVFVNVAIAGFFLPLPCSFYLTVLNGITEERVQQQVLQVCVSVERLFDFTQEHTVDTQEIILAGYNMFRGL